MSTAIVALTKKGAELAFRIAQPLDADIFVKNDGYDKVVLNGELVLIHLAATDFADLMKKVFHEYDELVLVMASGIAVRGIAPHLRSKQTDPAVVVADELGRFAISLLSGHIGGANRLAGKVAEITGGTPVITTATDINGVVAFDMLAADNDCGIENIEALKYISGELVNGGSVEFYTDCRLNGVLPDNIQPHFSGRECKLAVALTNSRRAPVKAGKILYLRPRNLILGIGCRKGKTKGEIEEAVADFLEKNNKSALSVRCVASISIKAAEKGIVEFCSGRGLPFKTFPAEKIRPEEHRFASSDFVKKTTGVGNVCEACAVLAGVKARLVCGKTVYNGITLALAEEEKVISL